MEAESSTSRGTGIASRFTGRNSNMVSPMLSGMRMRDASSTAGSGKFKINADVSYDQRVSIIDKRKKHLKSNTMDISIQKKTSELRKAFACGRSPTIKMVGEHSPIHKSTVS